MKEKVTRIEGRKTQKFDFKFNDDVLEYEIQEPSFDQLTASLAQVKTNGGIDAIGAGKVIWELCCVAHDVEIEDNPKILLAVCISLANEYAYPIDLEIKKK